MSLVPLDKIHPFDRVQVTRGDMVTVKRTLKLRRCVKMVTHELGEVVITAKALPVLEGPFLPRRGFSIILDRRDDKTWFWSAKSGGESFAEVPVKVPQRRIPAQQGLGWRLLERSDAEIRHFALRAVSRHLPQFRILDAETGWLAGPELLSGGKSEPRIFGTNAGTLTILNRR